MESLESVHGSAFGNLSVFLQTVRSGGQVGVSVCQFS